MEAIAFSQLQETMRTGTKALSDLSALNRKLTKAKGLKDQLYMREARDTLYKDIMVIGENLNKLQALLQIPATSMETCVVNQLKEAKKKYIKALCEVRRLNGAEKKARNEEIGALGGEVNRLQALLKRMKGESSSDEDSESDDDSDSDED